MSTHKDNNKHDGHLEFEQVVTALSRVPKADIDALEAARPKRRKRASTPKPRRKKS